MPPLERDHYLKAFASLKTEPILFMKPLKFDRKGRASGIGSGELKRERGEDTESRRGPGLERNTFWPLVRFLDRLRQGLLIWNLFDEPSKNV